MRTLKDVIINFIRGFCMSLADSVPGVSGGTIAFLLGFYDKFINSLDDLFYGKKQQRIAALKFLLKIAVGWIIGFGLSVLILTSLFESHIYAVSSVFIGFIIFAIPLVAIEEKNALKGRYQYLLFTLLGIALVVAITFLNPTSGSGIDVAFDQLTFGLGAYIFFAAMVAISAMVLPGISGSTLMLIFGLYIPMMSGLRALLHGDVSYLPVVLLFIVGCICGVLLFVRLIKLCLKKFRPQSIYLIIGMMLGSLYSVVQGPTTLKIPQEAMSLDTFGIGFFILGGVIVLGLQLLRRVMEGTSEK